MFKSIRSESSDTTAWGNKNGKNVGNPSVRFRLELPVNNKRHFFPRVGYWLHKNKRKTSTLQGGPNRRPSTIIETNSKQKTKIDSTRWVAHSFTLAPFFFLFVCFFFSRGRLTTLYLLQPSSWYSAFYTAN